METTRSCLRSAAVRILGEGAEGLGWVGDAAVEDDDGAGGEKEDEERAKSRSLTPLANARAGSRAPAAGRLTRRPFIY